MCVNCRAQEETLQHLFHSCALANQLWEKISFRCHKRGRVAEDIINTLHLWHKKPFKSGILNHKWKIIPGLIVWGIWKERKKRIFNDQIPHLENIWSRFCTNLKETLLIHTWTKEDLPILDNREPFGITRIFNSLA